MPFSWDDTKKLMRLQKVAEQLAAKAATARNVPSIQAVDRRMDAVIAEVEAILDRVEPERVGEFRRIVAAGDSGTYGAASRSAALLGWIEGAIAAETWEARTRAEAEELANARVRKERGVGFGSN